MTLAASQETPSLTIEIACAKCGYNLRTKRASEVCPECAYSVASSIKKHEAAILRNPRRAAWGAFLLAGSALLSALWTMLQLLRVFGYIHVYWTADPLLLPLEAIQVMAAAAMPAGILLLVSGATGAKSVNEGRVRFRRIWIAITLFACPLAAIACELSATTVWTGVNRPAWLNDRLPLLSIAANTAAAGMFIVMGVFLFKVARRRRWPLFAATTVVLFVAALVVTLAIGACVYVWWQIYPGWRPASWFNVFDFLRPALDFGGPCLIILLAFYWMALGTRCWRIRPGF